MTAVFTNWIMSIKCAVVSCQNSRYKLSRTLCPLHQGLVGSCSCPPPFELFAFPKLTDADARCQWIKLVSTCHDDYLVIYGCWTTLCSHLPAVTWGFTQEVRGRGMLKHVILLYFGNARMYNNWQQKLVPYRSHMLFVFYFYVHVKIRIILVYFWMLQINQSRGSDLTSGNDGKENCWSPTKYCRVCSIHFLDGRPTQQNPDPVLNLGHGQVRVSFHLAHTIKPQSQSTSTVWLDNLESTYG